MLCKNRDNSMHIHVTTRSSQLDSARDLFYRSQPPHAQVIDNLLKNKLAARGSIRVRSRQGAVFTIELPLSQQA